MQVGQRVRMKVPFHIDWLGTIEPGVTGVVQPYEPWSDDTVIGIVRLDVEHPLLTEHYGNNTCNEVYVYNPEHCDAGGWDDWEAIS